MFILLILFLTLSVLLSHRPLVAIVLQMCALAILTIGAAASYFLVEQIFNTVGIQNLKIVHLYYQNKALVQGEALNLSSRTLEACQVRVKGYEPPTNSLDYMSKLASPASTGVSTLPVPLAVNTYVPFEVELAGITYEQNITLSIITRCR
ncbi:hypothetical protein FACS1894103_3360 [Campylobacterota bacterium]|nr:hypothetical protein FACS1894103_3360 [Campylobacterota bacterium]